VRVSRHPTLLLFQRKNRFPVNRGGGEINDMGQIKFCLEFPGKGNAIGNGMIREIREIRGAKNTLYKDSHGSPLLSELVRVCALLKTYSFSREDATFCIL
jgi:hypothetical protein